MRVNRAQKMKEEKNNVLYLILNLSFDYACTKKERRKKSID